MQYAHMASTNRPAQLLIILAFAAIYIIWGSTYLAVLFAIHDIPPMFMSGGRFLTAGLLIYLFLHFRGERLPPAASLGRISLSGVLMLFVGTGAVAWVEQYIPSGLAAIIVATVPIWFVLLDRKHWRTNFRNPGIILGLIFGFAGVLVLFGDRKMIPKSNGMVITSVLVLMAGTVSWAIGSLYAKYRKMEGSTAMKAAVQMMAAGIAAMIAGFISGEHRGFAPASIGTSGWLAMGYLIFFGSLVGYMSYVWLLSVRSPAVVGTYAYVNPVVAVFLGWLIADETITRMQVIALAIILAGVILVTLTKNKQS